MSKLKLGGRIADFFISVFPISFFRFSLYFRTLRHLRWSQISGQVMTRLKKQWRDPAKMLAGQPASWKLSQRAAELDLNPPVPSQDAVALSCGTFCFINQTAELGSPVDWNAKGMPRLWSYNLHYFDWLWSLLDGSREVGKMGSRRSKVEGQRSKGQRSKGRKSEEDRVVAMGAEAWKEDGEVEGRKSKVEWDSAKRLTLDWIENHPPGKTAGGWEPYPVSLRLINWSLLYGLKCRDLVRQDEDFKNRLLESIGRQVKWLELNLETHIQANHLLENLVALVCVSSVFEGDESERVLAKYLPMLKRELAEQFLPDGMHYERSPMYHLRMLWLLEVLKWGSRKSKIESWEDLRLLDEADYLTALAGKMALALSKLRHPDGEIALFNDAVHGIYHDAWKDSDAELGSWALEDAGYYGFRDANKNYLIVDAGAVGPDYQPGHAHADYLSFELSMDGHRMITDTGIGSYDTGDRRSYDRSTAAHSTVEIDGENSAEVWGGFRVGRRVIPEVLEWSGAGKDKLFLKVRHDGYQHLPCRARHTRSFEWEGVCLKVRDTVEVLHAAKAVSRLHFSPECEVCIADDQKSVSIVLNGRRYHCAVEGNCEMSLENQPCCLEFGVDKKRSVLVMSRLLKPGKNQWRVSIVESV